MRPLRQKEYSPISIYQSTTGVYLLESSQRQEVCSGCCGVGACCYRGCSKTLLGWLESDGLLIYKRWSADTDLPSLSAALSQIKRSQGHQHSAHFSSGLLEELIPEGVPCMQRNFGRVGDCFLSVLELGIFSLELVECFALGPGTAFGSVLVVGAVSVVGTVSALEASVKACFSDAPKDLEANPSFACDLRRFLVPCLFLGLCLSVGLRVEVSWLSLCPSRVVRARKVRRP